MTRNRKKANTMNKVTKGITTLALTGALTASIGVSALAAPAGNMQGNGTGMESQKTEQVGDWETNQGNLPMNGNGASDMQQAGTAIPKGNRQTPAGQNDQRMQKENRRMPESAGNQDMPQRQQVLENQEKKELPQSGQQIQEEKEAEKPASQKPTVSGTQNRNVSDQPAQDQQTSKKRLL